MPLKCATSATIVQRQNIFVFSATRSYAAHVLTVTPICRLLLITWLKSWTPWPQSSWLRTVVFRVITTRKKQLSGTAPVMKNWFACFVLHLPTINALVLKKLLYQQKKWERSWRSRISDWGKRKLPSRLRYSSMETGIKDRDWCTYCLPQFMYIILFVHILLTYVVFGCDLVTTTLIMLLLFFPPDRATWQWRGSCQKKVWGHEEWDHQYVCWTPEAVGGSKEKTAR